MLTHRTTVLILLVTMLTQFAIAQEDAPVETPEVEKPQSRFQLKGRVVPATGNATLQGADKPAQAEQVVVSEQEDPRALIEEAPRDGRLVFTGQPTELEIEAFAAMGGRVVISTRTVEEMEELDFDEQQLVEAFGLTYINIPMKSSTVTDEEIRALGSALRSNGGPVLLHCGSGSRAAMLYGLHLNRIGAMTLQESRAHAIAMGMGDQMMPYYDKATMKAPQRVHERVDAARLGSSVETLASFGTRHTMSDVQSDTRGIGAARRWVRAQFSAAVQGTGKSGEVLPIVAFDTHRVQSDGRRITRDVDVVNVVCTIPGADGAARDRMIYVLAHLDSRALDIMDAESDAPGANDDASGVAALIELARVLAPENLGATVVLVATSGEEQGLFGARLHAQGLKAANAEVIAVLNNDTIGDADGVDDRSAPDEVRIFSEGLPLALLAEDPDRLATMLSRVRLYGMETDSPSRQLARYIKLVGKLHGELPVKPKLVFRPDRYLRGGDHTPFNELGYAAVRFCEVHEIYEHQHQDVRVEDGVSYGDLPEHVDPEYLAGVTKLNAVTIVHLANAPQAPTNARIIVAQLSNNTLLRWDPVPGATGYEVVYRDTTAPDWERFENVGDVTEAEIERSKDNWVFGIRAYNAQGYRSQVVFPIASRD